MTYSGLAPSIDLRWLSDTHREYFAWHRARFDVFSSMREMKV